MSGFADTTAMNVALRDVYSQFVSDHLNNEVRMLSLMAKAEEGNWDGTGRTWKETIRVGRNWAAKAVAERGKLPNPQTQKYGEWTVPMRYVYVAAGFTAQTMKQMRRGLGAAADGIEAELSGAVKDMQKSLNRMMWGSGRGIVATVNGDIGAGPETTIPLKDPGGVPSVQGGTPINGGRFIQPGMVLAFHAASPANNTPLAVRTVVSKAANGQSIVVDAGLANTTAPTNGVITVGVNRGGALEGSWEIEPQGMLGMVDNGDFLAVIQGVTRSAAPNIANSIVFANAGELDEMTFHAAYDAADEVAGAKPEYLVAHHSVHRQYIGITLSDKRYTGETLMRPDAGIVGGGEKRELQFSATTIMKDKDAPYYSMFGIDMSKMRKLEGLVGGEWIDEDGSILKQIEGEDTFVAFYRKFLNLYCTWPPANFVIRGINAPVTVHDSQ